MDLRAEWFWPMAVRCSPVLRPMAANRVLAGIPQTWAIKRILEDMIASGIDISVMAGTYGSKDPETFDEHERLLKEAAQAAAAKGVARATAVGGGGAR